jgi:hypothetical protein
MLVYLRPLHLRQLTMVVGEHRFPWHANIQEHSKHPPPIHVTPDEMAALRDRDRERQVGWKPPYEEALLFRRGTRLNARLEQAQGEFP